MMKISAFSVLKEDSEAAAKALRECGNQHGNWKRLLF